jgi:hypothetical protein
MDIRINDVQSRIQVHDSQRLLEPRILNEIKRACVAAMKEDQAREKRRAQDRKLTDGIAPERE